MGFTSSSVKRDPDCSLTVFVWVDSVVVTGFIQHRRCLVLLWRRRGYELVFCGGLWQIVSFFILFLLCLFNLCYWRLFLFCFVEMKMGGGFVPPMWFCLKILNLIFFWIEDPDSLVLALLCWMHISIQHDWFYLDVSRKN